MAGEIEKTPTANQSVMSPASGTYGEKADLNRLKGQLPPMGPAGGPGSGPVRPEPLPKSGAEVPVRPGGRPMDAPDGVPGALMGPTNRPEVPVGTPLSRAEPPSSAFANARSQRQARVTLLQQLQDSPEVSEATRQWARLVLETMIDADEPTI